MKRSSHCFFKGLASEANGQKAISPRDILKTQMNKKLLPISETRMDVVCKIHTHEDTCWWRIKRHIICCVIQKLGSTITLKIVTIVVSPPKKTHKIIWENYVWLRNTKGNRKTWKSNYRILLWHIKWTPVQRWDKPPHLGWPWEWERSKECTF